MLSSLYLSWKPNPHDDLASVLFRENGVIMGFAESSRQGSWGHCRVSPWPAFLHSCQVRAPPVSLFSLCPLFRKPITGVRKPLQSAEHRENHSEGEKRCGARRKPLSSRSNTRVLCSLPGQRFAVIPPLPKTSFDVILTLNKQNGYFTNTSMTNIAYKRKNKTPLVNIVCLFMGM